MAVLFPEMIDIGVVMPPEGIYPPPIDFCILSLWAPIAVLALVWGSCDLKRRAVLFARPVFAVLSLLPN